MGKGRKVGSDRLERLLGTYGYGQSHASAGDLHDLREEDVWSFSAAAAEEEEEYSSDRDDPWPPPDRTGRWIGHRPDRQQVGGLSLAFEDGYQVSGHTVVHQHRNADTASARGGGRHRAAAAASAPVNVPDWGRILRVDSSESMHESAEGDGGQWVPPHEYVAREHGKMVAASSVLEGAGRTLKGRDLSRVRDAVWSQTGFFG